MTLLSGATPPWIDPVDDTGAGTDGTVFDLAYWQNQKDAIDSLIHSLTNPGVTPADIIDEVVAARGAAANLAAILGGVVSRIDTNTTPVGNVGTADTNLMSLVLPAGKLAVDGQSLRVKAWGIVAANGNSKGFRLHFGGSFVTLSTTTGSGLHWCLDANIVRLGAASQLMVATFDIDTFATQAVRQAAPTEILSGAITIKMSGDGDATDDITQYAMITEFLS